MSMETFLHRLNFTAVGNFSLLFFFLGFRDVEAIAATAWVGSARGLEFGYVRFFMAALATDRPKCVCVSE